MEVRYCCALLQSFCLETSTNTFPAVEWSFSADFENCPIVVFARNVALVFRMPLCPTVSFVFTACVTAIFVRTAS